MPDNKEVTTDETLSGEQNVSSADGVAADKGVAQTTDDTSGAGSQPESRPSKEELNKLSVEELSEYLGKQFPNKEAALKAIKDTFSYVGKKKQEAVQEAIEKLGQTHNLVEEVQQLKKQVKEGQFYAEHPEYKGYKDLIEKFGDDPEKVVQSDEFKSVFEKIKGYDETVASQSVLSSNPRLAGAEDKLGKAEEALDKGDIKQAEESAVDAVLDAFPVE